MPDQAPNKTENDLSPRKGMSPEETDALVETILTQAKLEEKVAMLSGHGFLETHARSGVWGSHPYRAGAGCERLGVPALFFTDGPRGVARGQSTAFPCTMARGASFDTDLERRIGEAMAIEIRAQGCNLSGAVCINLLRHPAWGRAQETYGEDTFHLGEMGAALAEGLQTHNVIATVKHFALNSMENARFRINVRIDERALHEVYLPHFRRVLEAGCASVMSAYNKVNGTYCGENRRLLTDILRHEWGFEGFVHSDWILGVHEPCAVSAGLDIENPEPVHFGAKLVDAVRNGQISEVDIDTACRRILRTLYRFASAEDPLESYTEDQVASYSHRMLAREAAEKSAVLLRNDGILPIDLSRTPKIAVLGRLARLEITGDNGSSRVRPPYVVSPLSGLTAYAGEDRIVFSGDEDDIRQAAQQAANADIAIVVVGYTAREEGEFIPGDINLGQEREESGPAESPEGSGYTRKGANDRRGGDRVSLALPPEQEALIAAVGAANPRTIVIVVAGSAVIFGNWAGSVAGLMQTFYSGMEGGHALARLIFGEVSPSGRLPFTIAGDAADYPFFDMEADEITYDYWHGYRLFERTGKPVIYPFGFGLTYSHFTYRALKARRLRNGNVHVQVSLLNSGSRPASEVVQVYVAPPGRDAERAKKSLCAFSKAALEPGETKTLHFEIEADTLKWYDPALRAWRLEPGAYGIFAGGSSLDEHLLHTNVNL